MIKNVAITGSFASGKTFILEYINSIGYKVFSCDDYVKEIYKNNNTQKILEDNIVELDSISKQKLANIIYDNPQVRKKLESIIHPMIREGIKSFEAHNRKENILFTEVPLLFESGFDKYFSHSICVYCSENTRYERALSRGVKKNLFNKIKNIQFSQEYKKQNSDFTINTEQDLDKVIASLTNIISKII